jgi:hypothetical protein
MGANSRRRRQGPAKQDRSKTTPNLTDTPAPATSFSSKENDGNVVVAAAAADDWKTILKNHPLVWALVLIGIPYGLHLATRWILLQHPITDVTRPAVGLMDPRQVLILGSMSSGTSSMALALQDELQLEVGHEDSDTLWKFVRDGTVSWFHGIRYWPKSTTTKNNTEDNEFSSSSMEESSIPQQLCKVSWFLP